MPAPRISSLKHIFKLPTKDAQFGERDRPHLAGDGSFREEKKFKEFGQFRFNLLIKISYTYS